MLWVHCSPEQSYCASYGTCEMKSELRDSCGRLTSRSSPAATVMMSPVSLLMVNMLGEGVLGAWDRILYLSIPFWVFGSSASMAVTVITYVPGHSTHRKRTVGLHLSASHTAGMFAPVFNLNSTFPKQACNHTDLMKNTTTNKNTHLFYYYYFKQHY